MNWFERFLRTSAIIREWDAGSDEGYRYFDIGHGDYNEESGFEPAFQIWAVIDGELHLSPLYEPDEEGEFHESGTHGTLWGHDVTDRSWKGRYEPDTGYLTIVIPDSYRFRNVEPFVEWITSRLPGPVDEVWVFR